MKKCMLLLMSVILGSGLAFAGPVDVNQAMNVGQKFVQGNFENSRQSLELSLVTTYNAANGDVCFYVFNVGSEGYIIVSADDTFRPIIAYSTESVFPTENISPDMNSYLSNFRDGMASVMNTESKATPAIAAEWKSILNCGKSFPNNRGGVPYLIKEKWNQDYPYNYYCPADAQGPGGRVYAGCVATAMSLIMKYWEHPTQGTGQHSYYASGYGQQTANFGATTYDFANMPIQISSSSPQEEIDAIATLMYHCGVSVNMMYAPDGSGAYSQDVPAACSQYFGYTTAMFQRFRMQVQLPVWEGYLKESFNCGWPLYYSGSSSQGGHAFVCDGYDENDLFHFNFGWGGSGNGYFQVDAIDYSGNAAAIFNFVPAGVYNNTPAAPTNLNVVPGADNALTATLSWKNPSVTLSNVAIGSIDRIVIERDGVVIHTIDNPTPGADLTYVDNEVPRYDVFDYSVYAVKDDAHGKTAVANRINVGPVCNWTFTINSSDMLGWRGASVSVINAAGHKIDEVTANSSALTNKTVSVPLGRTSLVWTAPTTSVSTVTLIVKDSQNNTVYQYIGSSDELAAGVIYEGNNSCGNNSACETPTNVIAQVDPNNSDNIIVSWDAVSNPQYGYNVYRNDILYRLIPNATSFVDENPGMGGHCYYVTVLGQGGETGQASNESCTTLGECYPPTNLNYELTGSNNKIKLLWQKPEPSEGLSGYYIYRRPEGGVFERIKLAGASATSYTDNSNLAEGFYDYKVVAYYGQLDCFSAPANWIYDSNKFYLHVYYSVTGVTEEALETVKVYPNPTRDDLTIQAEGLRQVEVYNTLGQVVCRQECQADQIVISVSNLKSGIYMVKVYANDGESTRRISVVR